MQMATFIYRPKSEAQFDGLSESLPRKKIQERNHEFVTTPMFETLLTWGRCSSCVQSHLHLQPKIHLVFGSRLLSLGHNLHTVHTGDLHSCKLHKEGLEVRIFVLGHTHIPLLLITLVLTHSLITLMSMKWFPS